MWKARDQKLYTGTNKKYKFRQYDSESHEVENGWKIFQKYNNYIKKIKVERTEE